MVAIANLSKELESREAARREAFAELVAKLASGKKVAVDDVERIIAEAGKSNADLLQAVETAQSRAARRAERSKLPEITARIAEIDNGIEKANTALIAAQNQHASTVQPLEFERRQLAEKRFELERIDDTLAVECPDADLVERHERADAEARKLDREIRNATDARDRVKAAYSATVERNEYRRSVQGATLDAASERDQLAIVERAEAALKALAERKAAVEAERDELWLARSKA